MFESVDHYFIDEIVSAIKAGNTSVLDEAHKCLNYKERLIFEEKLKKAYKQQLLEKLGV